MIRALTTSAASLALLAAPTLAAAAPLAQPGVSRAAALSLSPAQRAGTSAKRSTKLTQQGTIIAAVLAIGVIAGGVILVADSDDDPDSP